MFRLRRAVPLLSSWSAAVCWPPVSVARLPSVASDSDAGAVAGSGGGGVLSLARAPFGLSRVVADKTRGRKRDSVD